MADLIAIGRGIDRQSPFASEFVGALRPSLGDWRDLTMPAVEPLVDPLFRVGLYHERGFDAALTDFTVPAFEETVRVAGLETDETMASGDDDDGFGRASWAFEQLRRFEVSLRRFIDRVMRDAFGNDWMKHQLPANMLDAWVAKRDKALAAGEAVQPLIDYADFADYRPIIERKDNWNKIR